MFTIVLWVYVSLFECFKQLPANFTLILSLLLLLLLLLLLYFIVVVRLLSDVVGDLIVSSDNPLDFDD